MTWWQTLLVATIPALITLVGLLVQQTILGNRERERRESDARQRELDRADTQKVRDDTRRDALADHWREERKQAHVEFLSALEAAHRAYAELGNDGREMAKTDREFLSKTLGPNPNKALDSVHEGLTTLELIADEASLEAARAATEMTTAYWNHTTILVVADALKNDRDDAKLRHTVQEWLWSVDAYRKAVRRELGTATNASAEPTRHEQ